MRKLEAEIEFTRLVDGASKGIHGDSGRVNQVLQTLGISQDDFTKTVRARSDLLNDERALIAELNVARSFPSRITWLAAELSISGGETQ